MNATYNTIETLVADRRHAFEATADRQRLVASSRGGWLLAHLPTPLVPRALRDDRHELCETPTTAAA